MIPCFIFLYLHKYKKYATVVLNELNEHGRSRKPMGQIIDDALRAHFAVLELERKEAKK